MSTRHRYLLRTLALMFAFTLVAGLPLGCGSSDPVSQDPTDPRPGENIKDQDYERPQLASRDRLHYQNILAQLPLRMMDAYQDFSHTDTVDFDKAWMVGLYYFNQGGTRELYSLFSNHDLYRLRAGDMSLDWSENLEARPEYPPVVSNQFVYWITKGPRVVWYYREGQPDGYQKRWEEVLHVKPCSPPIANDQGIYFGSSEYFRVYGINSAFEREMWFWPHNQLNTGRVAKQPHADDDRLYFYSENGRFYSINTSDGSENWVWPRDGEKTTISARPTMKYDIIFMGTWDTNLYALDKSSKAMFQFPAGEPIVGTPFVSDRYILFTTPRNLVCIRFSYNDAGNGKTWARLVSEKDLANGRNPDEALWKVPIVPPDAMSLRDDKVLLRPDRRKLEVLMVGRNWVYLLEHVERSGRKYKYLYRVDAADGQFESETKQDGTQVIRRYDVSQFPYVLQNDDENNRTLYFGTYEGFIFGMRE